MDAAPIRASPETYERALAILNAIALAGHEAAMRLRITERLEKKTRTRRRYDGATEPETYFVPIGRLTITIDEARQVEDTADQKLESLLNDFFVAAYNSVVPRRITLVSGEEIMKISGEARSKTLLLRAPEETLRLAV